MSKPKVLIVGSGPAGYTAGIYAARAGLQAEIIAGIQPGGQLTITTDVDNWPASPGIQGPELMEKMREHCQGLACVIHADRITQMLSTERPFVLKGENAVYEGDSVILASGASAKMLNLSDETAYLGKGVSSCATCDGFFYRGKKVGVVGGGNTAAEEALYLAGVVRHVVLIHRRDTLRADVILQERLFHLEKEGKLTFLWNRSVVAYLGDEKGLIGVRLDDGTEIDLDGLFIAIGHTPNTSFLGDHLELNKGYIRLKGSVNNQTATSIEGIFAAGDVADAHYRQAITSAGMGCMAALDVKQYLEGIR